MFFKIFKNEIMYYVIMPIMVLILNWLKNGYDIRGKNKELGYWEMKYKRLDTFIDITMNIYKWMAINLITMQFVRIVFSMWYKPIYVYFISAFIYIIINVVLIILVYKNPKTQSELLKNKKAKKILLIAIFLIYVASYFLGLADKFENFLACVLGVILIVWLLFLFKYSDRAYILDSSFADIYVNGSEKAEFAAAGTIRKQGDWIIVNRYINEYKEEIRIKEKDIVRIDYYGDPIIFVK